MRPPAVPWHIVRAIVLGMLAPNGSDKRADNRTETVGKSGLAIEQEHTTITARSYGRDADLPSTERPDIVRVADIQELSAFGLP